MDNIIMKKLDKRMFNPSNKKDLAELKFFIKNGKWKTTCPFETEHPYLNVVDMVLRKFTSSYIDSILKQQNQTTTIRLTKV